MMRRVCRAKVSNATVTITNVEYEGSLGLDSAILEAAELAPYEMVLVANVSNSSRFETYLIAEPAGSGKVAVYGAAAKLVKPGDSLILICYGFLTDDDLKSYRGPKVVRLKPGNKLP